MPKEVASFKLNGICFSIETNQGFGNTMSQLQLSAQSEDSKKVVEIFDIRKMGDKMHISPNIKKVTRVDFPKDSKQVEMESEDAEVVLENTEVATDPEVVKAKPKKKSTKDLSKDTQPIDIDDEVISD